ncbi:MAG: Rpn family recombination-promoting nuclease/putative transposase [Solitalea sp.]
MYEVEPLNRGILTDRLPRGPLPLRTWLPANLPGVMEPRTEPYPLIRSRFLDPLTDYGFKRLFGTEANKKVLIGFLNSLFDHRENIRDITYLANERIGPVKESKKIIHDILCIGEKEERFIVEMQRADQHFFKNRMLFYSSRAIGDQIPKGKQPVDYDIRETYSIGILDFILPDSPPNEFLHDVVHCYWSSRERFHDKPWYKFVELPKFTKSPDELSTDLDKWVYLLKNMRNMRSIPPVLNTGLFREVFEKSEISNLPRKEYNMYRSSLQDEADFQSAIKLATERATEKATREATASKAGECAANLIRETDFDNLTIGRLAGLEESAVEAIRMEQRAKI